MAQEGVGRTRRQTAIARDQPGRRRHEDDLAEQLLKRPDCVAIAFDLLLGEQKVQRVPLSGYWNAQRLISVGVVLGSSPSIRRLLRRHHGHLLCRCLPLRLLTRLCSCRRRASEVNERSEVSGSKYSERILLIAQWYAPYLPSEILTFCSRTVASKIDYPCPPSWHEVLEFEVRR
jgi:hypothetical protein